MNKLICGDSAQVLKEFPDNHFDMVLTSPPYDSVRSYSDNLASWSTEAFETIATQLYRTTKNGGVVCWVVNDQYIDGGRSLTSFKQALFFQSLGFKMHDCMIYQKSGFNFPANNRYHQVYEFIFVLSKGKPKTFNPLIDRKNAYPGQKAHGKHRGANENDYRDMSQIVKAKPAGEYGKRYNVWYVKVGGGHVASDKFAHCHPAIFPESLAGDLIYSFSNEGDIILDPFLGSGTTIKMAAKMNRSFVGIDVSEEYIRIASQRLESLQKAKTD